MLDLWYIAALVSSVVAILVVKLLRDYCWGPLQLHHVFKEQGITGPPSRLFVGNMPDIRKIISETSSKLAHPVTHDVVVSKVLPYYAKWSKAYGETFIMWWGFQPRLMISDPELIKEVLCDWSGNYDRDPRMHAAKDLFGEGLAMLRMDDKWSKRRKMVAMAFHMEKLKAMISMMAASAEENLNKWQANKSMEMDFALEVKNLTADVICRTAFGTSYEAGKRIFELQTEQQRIFMEWGSSVHMPGMRFLPTSKNRYRWNLKKEIDSLLLNMVQQRMQELQCRGGTNGYYGNDLLGLMMVEKEGNLDRKSNISMKMQDVIDECKTFFFTGQETTAAMLAWTTMLLALSPGWQERLREEVLEVCGNSAPTKLETLNNLKNMNMVLNEAMRLYPPAPCLQRYAYKDVTLKSLFIPAGTVVLLPVVLTNHSEKIWGKDVEEFNPNRFANADSLHATKAFMPFSVGPRSCVGQNFAMLEAKVILSMILQRFRFKLSEAYIHAPFHVMALKPQFGIPMILSPI